MLGFLTMRSVKSDVRCSQITSQPPSNVQPRIYSGIPSRPGADSRGRSVPSDLLRSTYSTILVLKMISRSLSKHELAIINTDLASRYKAFCEADGTCSHEQLFLRHN